MRVRAILILSVFLLLISVQHVFAAASGASCGQWASGPITCLDPTACSLQTSTCPDGSTVYFCGPPVPTQLCQQFGQSPSGDGTGINAETLDRLNTVIFDGPPDAQLTTPRGIISRLLPYLMTFGGLILFIMLIWGGFEMLTGAANPKSQEAGKQRITSAIIGFILLFSSYWLAQLVQAIFGISIL